MRLLTRHCWTALLALTTGCSSSTEAIPTPTPITPTVRDSLSVAFTAPAFAPVISSIAVAGTFNNWSTTDAPLQRQPDGTWLIRLAVTGLHEYKFVINGAWIADMCNDPVWGNPGKNLWVDPGALGCVSDGFSGRNAVIDLGASTSATDIGFRHDPAAPAQLSMAGGQISVRFRAREQRVISATITAGGTTTAMQKQLSYRLQDVWRGTVAAGSTSYSISVVSSAGTQNFGPFTVPSALFRAVPWVGSAVGYQIFPERFNNGDRSNDSLTITTDEYPYLSPALRGNRPALSAAWDAPSTSDLCCHQYYGGDLQGVVDKLDYLQSIGVTLLYLNPIFSSGSAHGYDTWDYLTVEPSFGTEATVRTLLQQAHARGMKVIWDFVPNHVGLGAPQFVDALAKGTASPTWNWFTFKVAPSQVQAGNGNHYDTFFGVGSMPKLNTANTAVRDHLMSAVTKWTQFGFDGIRVDVPQEVADGTNFFHTFRQTAKALNPDVYLVGEIWNRAPEWLQGDKFDALMNYALGQDAVEHFARGDMNAPTAAAVMSQLFAEYPEASAAMAFNVISTHDNARLLTKMGGGSRGSAPSADALARQRLASAMLFAMPGVPVTFQGDECAFLGDGGGGSRDQNRYPMQWDACDQTTVAHYRQLAQLRKTVPALTSPVIRFNSAAGSVLSFFRGESGAGEVLAVFNAGDASVPVTLPAGTWVDVATQESVTGSAPVAARGWRYLRRG